MRPSVYEATHTHTHIHTHTTHLRTVCTKQMSTQRVTHQILPHKKTTPPPRHPRDRCAGERNRLRGVMVLKKWAFLILVGGEPEVALAYSNF
jgi:hypothetical protein